MIVCQVERQGRVWYTGGVCWAVAGSVREWWKKRQWPYHLGVISTSLTWYCRNTDVVLHELIVDEWLKYLESLVRVAVTECEVFICCVTYFHYFFSVNYRTVQYCYAKSSVCDVGVGFMYKLWWIGLKVITGIISIVFLLLWGPMSAIKFSVLAMCSRLLADIQQFFCICYVSFHIYCSFYCHFFNFGFDAGHNSVLSPSRVQKNVFWKAQPTGFLQVLLGFRLHWFFRFLFEKAVGKLDGWFISSAKLLFIFVSTLDYLKICKFIIYWSLEAVLIK